MSYILEALKKSQQERELGHVPTLESTSFTVEEGSARPSPWVLSAMILAALAVVIALYSAVRGNLGAPRVAEPAPQESQSAAGELADRVPPPTQTAAGPVAEEPDPLLSAPRPEDTESSAPVTEVAEEPAPSVVVEAPKAPPPEAVPPPPVQVPSAPPEPPPAPVRSERTQVPEDLIADIEAFKREIREEQSSKVRPKKVSPKIKPQDLRLPKEMRNRLPEFVMSAHIYDQEPTKRFVLINGLKTREGEESREEITVEEILPDGAILSFEGNRFFQRR
jgi:general secretion pathway protein B